MLYLLPQLPVRNRYSENWIKIWERELDKLGVEYQTLGTRCIFSLKKYFTNPVNALRNECNQIKKLCQKDLSKDSILVLDIDFPGLITPAVQVLKLVYPELKVYGFLHAGSYNYGDIFEKTQGKKNCEIGMLETFDKIFVSTNYHRQKIEDYFGVVFDNIEVVGFPLYQEDIFKYVTSIPYSEKKYILFTGRPEQSDYTLIDSLKKQFSKEKFLILKTRNRKKYFELLNKSKIVISLKREDTFGLTQLEAYILGSIPLSPKKYAYPETIGFSELLYDDKEDLLVKLNNLLLLQENSFKIGVENYRFVISNIISKIEQGIKKV